MRGRKRLAVCVRFTEMPQDVRGQRAGWIDAARALDDLHAGKSLRIPLDLGHHGQRHVLDHHVIVQLLGHRDRIRRTPVDVLRDALDAGLDFAGAAAPLVGPEAAQFRQAAVQFGPLVAQARLLAGHSLGIAAPAPGQTPAGSLPEPPGVGRLLEIAVMHREGLNLLVAGQHGAVAGEDSAADARNVLLLANRPGGLRAKGRALAHLDLHRPTEHHGQTQDEHGQADPQPARRGFDDRRAVHFAAMEVVPVDGHG